MLCSGGRAWTHCKVKILWKFQYLKFYKNWSAWHIMWYLAILVANMKRFGPVEQKLWSGHERADLTQVFNIQNSIKIPKFKIFKKIKFMTHHMVLGNICAKYEGNRSCGYEVMLRTRKKWPDPSIQNSIKIPSKFQNLKFSKNWNSWHIIWYWGISVPNMKEIGRVVMKLCSGHGVTDTHTHTDRQTDRQTDIRRL